MTQAENYAILFDGGNHAQAQKLADSMSLWKAKDWEKEVTVYGFEDGSAIFACGSEFRVATAAEMAAHQ